MNKSCDKMGFTERASCRPYKNCYKNKMIGGKSRNAKTKRGTTARKTTSRKTASKKSATRKSAQQKTSKHESGNIKPSSRHINKPSFVYHSEHTSYTSHPDGKTPYGKRTIVNIKNGEGKKRLEVLDKNGKILTSNYAKLNPNELQEVKQGKYVPGLWNPFSLLRPIILWR
jgi:hypothetical protein